MRLTPRVAGFRLEYPAGFELECMAGFVGTRSLEANQAVQPRPVCSDRIEIPQANRNNFPDPPVQP